MSILNRIPITLLDYDFTIKELENLGIFHSHLKDKFFVKSTNTSGYFKLFKSCSENNSWRITLFTSGTQGLPKKVEHTWNTLTKAVRVSGERRNDIWGLAYNPTHIAGLQVFFQALLNQNTIVNLFQLSREHIFEQIEKHKITHISATPTFFRMLLPVSVSFPSVRRITSGGEKFDTSLSEQLEKMFPNASLLNVYASTEAGTLFASRGDVFNIKPGMQEFVKIENNELLIHKDWMARSDSFNLDGAWYHTGDLVEIVDEEAMNFRFVSRNNDMINVGGYKVNPSEVEDMINSHDKVKNCHVYGKPHPLIGNILVCDVLPMDTVVTEQELRIFLRDMLQDHKIPRIINFVNVLETTRTGKLRR